jgi:hypothetical protein
MKFLEMTVKVYFGLCTIIMVKTSSSHTSCSHHFWKGKKNFFFDIGKKKLCAHERRKGTCEVFFWIVLALASSQLMGGEEV